MLSNSLKELRASRGMSQAELAEKLGVRQQTVGKWESSVTVPRQPMLQKLADIFGVTTDYLLGRSNTPATPTYKPTVDAASEVFDDEIRTLARAKLKDSSPEQVAERKEQVKKMIEVFW